MPITTAATAPMGHERLPDRLLGTMRRKLSRDILQVGMGLLATWTQATVAFAGYFVTRVTAVRAHFLR